MSAPFVHRDRIRFHQADPAGVLFFGRVTELFQAAYEELVEAMGLDRRAHFAQDTHSTPIAHMEIDYHAPLPHGADVEVQVQTQRIGRRSFTLGMTVALGDAPTRPCVTGLLVFVHTRIEGQRFQPTPLPSALRAGLERFAEPSL